MRRVSERRPSPRFDGNISFSGLRANQRCGDGKHERIAHIYG